MDLSNKFLSSYEASAANTRGCGRGELENSYLIDVTRQLDTFKDSVNEFSSALKFLLETHFALFPR